MKKFVTLVTAIIISSPPIWFVGDRWVYNVGMEIKSKNMDGSIQMNDFAMKVIREDENSYVVRASGNISGKLILHKFRDIVGSITGKANTTFSICKENFSIMKGSIFMNGFMLFMENKIRFYLILNMSFIPPYRVIVFPLEENKRWLTKSNISIEGSIYVERFIMPPQKIERSNITVTEFKCNGLDRVEVKAGKYEAWHITSRNTDIWYAEDVKNIIKMVIKDIKIKDTNITIDLEMEKYKIKEIKSPEVKITRPKNCFYVFDREIMETNQPVIIGDITVKAEANGSNLQKMEFYFDEKLGYVDNSPPYEWKCDEKGFGKRELKCIVYDAYGNKADDEIEMLYLNP